MLIVQCDTEHGCGTYYDGKLDKCPSCGGSQTLLGGLAQLPFNSYIYDIETYCNIFTCAVYHPCTDTKWMFEVSTRKNEALKLIQFLYQLKNASARMIGFNNVNFDYPVLHYIVDTGSLITVDVIYNKAMSIINSPRGSYSHIIYDNQMLVEQVDLFKLNHYDNKARSTSLKALEFYMKMESIQDLPYEPGTWLTDLEMNNLISYNWHDILATGLFYALCLEQIAFRDEMSTMYGKNMVNMSDSKIGSVIFEMRLNEAGITTKGCKTFRDQVELKDCISDSIVFERPEFNEVLKRFKETTLIGTNVKALFKDFTATIDGHEFAFGAGGIHSCSPGVYEEDNEYEIQDWDVQAYYPSNIIANNIFPKHLTSTFSPNFKELVDERMRVGKKTTKGAALKIAANGSFGNFGNEYSYLYDLKAMLSTTLMGQLALCMLMEQMFKIPNLTMIQSNTDGFTIRVPKIYNQHIKQVVKWWENKTGLIMELAQYKKLWIPNVNSYIAQYESGDLKLKKDYLLDLEPHKDASALIIPKAAVAQMVEGIPIEQTINESNDPYDFCIRGKVPYSNKLVLRYKDFNVDIKQQKITRYFISKTGASLVKIAPLNEKHIVGNYKRANKLTDDYFNEIMNEIGQDIWDPRIHTKNKSKHEDNTETGINANELVTVCNDIKDFNWNNLDKQYYINKAKQLIIGG